MDSRIEDHASCIVVHAACRSDDESPKLMSFAIDLSLEVPSSPLAGCDGLAPLPGQYRSASIEAEPAFKIPLA